MTYIAITEEQSNPFAPITSELLKQLRDNPLAIAGGLEGAPRNVPLSLDLRLGTPSFTLSGETPVEFVGLSGLTSILVVASVGGFFVGQDPQGTALQVAYSTNNGGSWSGWQNVVGASGDSFSGVTRHIDLSEGRLDMRDAITGAAGSNALRFRKSTLLGSGRVALIGLGRT